jgi:hypothetical protein
MILSFSWITWILKACGVERTSCRPSLRKWSVAWWILVSPVIGFAHFVLIQLPRVIVLWEAFWTTIFQLCAPDVRADGLCTDFYSLPVPEAPWVLIWILWVAFYVHAFALHGFLLKRLVYDQVPKKAL